MPFMQPVLAYLISLVVQWGMKLGYGVITDTVCLGLDAWADTTPTHKDDLVIQKVAAAIGVDKDVLQEMIDSKSKEAAPDDKAK